MHHPLAGVGKPLHAADVVHIIVSDWGAAPPEGSRFWAQPGYLAGDVYTCLRRDFAMSTAMVLSSIPRTEIGIGLAQL